jgi:hypothetical protein
MKDFFLKPKSELQFSGIKELTKLGNTSPIMHCRNRNEADPTSLDCDESCRNYTESTEGFWVTTSGWLDHVVVQVNGNCLEKMRNILTKEIILQTIQQS